MVNTALSYAAIEWRHLPLITAIASQSLRSIHQWTACELSSTAWSFARLGCQHLPLMQATAEPSRAQLSELTLVDIANTAWALEGLGIPARRQFRSLVNAHGLEDFLLEAVRDVNSHGIEMIHFADYALRDWQEMHINDVTRRMAS